MMRDRIACSRGHRTRGTCMTYLTGLSAVMMLVVAAMADQYLRSYLSVERNKERAQALWIARAGITFALQHQSEVTTGTGLAQWNDHVGMGSFSVRMEQDKTGRVWIVSSGQIPGAPAAPRVQEIVKCPANASGEY